MMLYNRLLQEFCVECGHTLADAKAVISAGGAGSLFGPDGYHLTERGGAAVAEVLRDLILQTHAAR
jgi:hypothetical protein